MDATPVATKQTRAKARPRPSTVGQRGPRRDSMAVRAAVLATAVMAVVASLYGAFVQPPRLNPFAQPLIPWLDFILNRVERNTFRRLPVVSSVDAVTHAYRVPGTEHIWIVGKSGLLLRSTDAGATWKSQAINWPEIDARRVRPGSVLSVVTQNAQQSPTAAPVPLAQSPPTLNWITFADTQRGWIAADRGTLLATSDGGSTWREIPAVSRQSSDRRLGWVSLSPDQKTLIVAGDGLALWVSADVSPDDAPTAPAIVLAGDVVRLRSAAVAGANRLLAFSSMGIHIYDPTEKNPSYFTGSVYGGVFTSDGKRGWIATAKGLAETRDGGYSFRLAGVPTENALAAYTVAFSSDMRRGISFEDSAYPSTTEDGGENWGVPIAPAGHLAPVPARERIVAAQFGEDNQTVWAMTLGGEVLVSPDTGRTWTRRGYGFSVPLSPIVADASGSMLWATGARGTLLYSADRGGSWKHLLQSPAVITVGAAPDQKSACFGGPADIGERGLWAPVGYGARDVDTPPVWIGCTQQTRVVTAHGTLTGDGGEVFGWRLQFADEDLVGAVTAPDGTAYVFTELGRVLRSTDNGVTWSLARSKFILPPGQIAFVDAQEHAWSFSEAGVCSQPLTSDVALTCRATGGGPPLRALARASDGAIWVAGDRGTLKRTTNGETWEPRPAPGQTASGTPHDLRGVWFHSRAPFGFLTASDGTTWRSEDGGASWQEITYGLYPAPWSYAVFVLGGLLLYSAMRPSPVSGDESVADMAISDRPIDSALADRLNLATTGRGLARFLGNAATEPPLTIAITGEWGTGKTSLMNLVREGVAGYGFRTVGFNAWHHQTDEHLLGSLLASLRTDALPPWWRPDGFATRLWLLMRRGVRHFVLTLAMTAVFFIAIGYIVRYPSSTATVTMVSHFLSDVSVLWEDDRPRSNAEATNTLSGDTQVNLLALLAALGPIVTFVRGMRAFGGARFAAGVRAAGLKDIEAPVGFRQEFARVFRDVTWALGDRRLVIFIDDLDRCRPDRVVAVLELVNFLVSSGDCFIVIGMAWDRVERCVGLAFKDVAEEIDDPRDDGEAPRSNDGERGRQRRAEFARQYLEKLINVEVPVPTLTPARAAALVAAADPRPVTRFLVPLRSIVSRWSAAAAVVAVAIGGFYLGSRSTPSSTPQPVVVEAPIAPATPVAASGTAANTDRPPTPPNGALPTSVKNTPIVFTPGRSEIPPWPSVLIVAIIAVAIGVYRFSIPPPRHERDSAAFSRALADATPAILGRTPTPRAIKRFLNRVRYYAMRQRTVNAPVGRMQEIRSDLVTRMRWIWRLIISGRTAATADPADPMTSDTRVDEPALPEHVLVALGVVQHVRPEWLQHDGFWRDPGAYAKRTGDSLLAGATASQLKEIERHREQFLALSAGVHVN